MQCVQQTSEGTGVVCAGAANGDTTLQLQCGFLDVILAQHQKVTHVRKRRRSFLRTPLNRQRKSTEKHSGHEGRTGAVVAVSLPFLCLWSLH